MTGSGTSRGAENTRGGGRVQLMVILGRGTKVKFVGVERGRSVLRDGARSVPGTECWVPATSDDRKEERCEGPRLTLAGGKGAKCVWEARCGCVGRGKQSRVK
jgi:hypothetical protein